MACGKKPPFNPTIKLSGFLYMSGSEDSNIAVISIFHLSLLTSLEQKNHQKFPPQTETTKQDSLTAGPHLLSWISFFGPRCSCRLEIGPPYPGKEGI